MTALLPLPLQAVGGTSPRSLTEHFSDILLALNHSCPALLAQWLEETLQTPGFPSAEVSSEQKQTFSQQLLRSDTLWNRFFRYCAAPSCTIQHHTLAGIPTCVLLFSTSQKFLVNPMQMAEAASISSRIIQLHWAKLKFKELQLQIVNETEPKCFTDWVINHPMHERV